MNSVGIKMTVASLIVFILPLARGKGNLQHGLEYRNDGKDTFHSLTDNVSSDEYMYKKCRNNNVISDEKGFRN